MARETYPYNINGRTVFLGAGLARKIDEVIERARRAEPERTPLQIAKSQPLFALMAKRERMEYVKSLGGSEEEINQA